MDVHLESNLSVHPQFEYSSAHCSEELWDLQSLLSKKCCVGSLGVWTQKLKGGLTSSYMQIRPFKLLTPSGRKPESGENSRERLVLGCSLGTKNGACKYGRCNSELKLKSSLFDSLSVKDLQFA